MELAAAENKVRSLLLSPCTGVAGANGRGVLQLEEAVSTGLQLSQALIACGELNQAVAVLTFCRLSSAWRRALTRIC